MKKFLFFIFCSSPLFAGYSKNFQQICLDADSPNCFTSTGTFLTNASVVAGGSCTNCSVTFNNQGQATNFSNGSGGGTTVYNATSTAGFPFGASFSTITVTNAGLFNGPGPSTFTYGVSFGSITLLNQGNTRIVFMNGSQLGTSSTFVWNGTTMTATKISSPLITSSTFSVLNQFLDGSFNAGNSGDLFTSNGAASPPTWHSSSGLGTTIYNATSTAGFPFGASFSTISVTASGNNTTPAIFLTGTPDQGISLTSSDIGIIHGNASIANFNGSAITLNQKTSIPLTAINLTSTESPISIQTSRNSLDSQFPYTLIEHLMTRSTGLFGYGYSGIRFSPGEDLKYVIDGSSFTPSDGYGPFPIGSNAPFIVDISTSSSSYGFVGVGVSTPTFQLHVNTAIGFQSGVLNSSITFNGSLMTISTATQFNGPLSVVTTSTSPNTLSNGVIVGGHIEVSSTTPVISSCGSTPNGSVVGNDFAGKITIGGGVVTACTMTFAAPWVNSPACTIGSNTAITSPTVATSTTTLTLGSGATFNGDIIMYLCGGYR